MPSEVLNRRRTPAEKGADPCVTQPFSWGRFAVLALLFVAMLVGIVSVILLADKPYGIQLSSSVTYTAAAALYTFSRNGNRNQPFLLCCPVVRGQLSRLINRHLCCLAILFAVQTAALNIRPKLPAYWITPSSRDPSAFSAILAGICGCLLIVQILSNRSLLERAHVSSQEACHDDGR
jgi:hypothetical protein